MRLSTCTSCGRPYERRVRWHGKCPTCAPTGRALRSPTTRAQRDGTGDYERNRAILLASNPPCHYCGKPATTADHRIAVGDGGTHALSNLVPACGPCNFSKQDRPGWTPPRHRL